MNVVPEATVQHPDTPVQGVLKVNDTLFLADKIRTLKSGRVRIALLDGSNLYIGPRAIARIVKHDPQSQQTNIELQLGTLRVKTPKHSHPDASLQVKTLTSLVWAAETSLVISSLSKNTTVRCIEGTASVRNVDPSIPDIVTIHAGEQTQIDLNHPPTHPRHSSPADISNDLNATNVG